MKKNSWRGTDIKIFGILSRYFLEFEHYEKQTENTEQCHSSFCYDANELWGFSLEVPIREKDYVDGLLGLKGHPLSRQKFKKGSNSQ